MIDLQNSKTYLRFLKRLDEMHREAKFSLLLMFILLIVKNDKTGSTHDYIEGMIEYTLNSDLTDMEKVLTNSNLDTFINQTI